MSDARLMRADLVESARLDLLGPVEERELLFDYRVRDRYLVGMLATDGTVATDPAQVDDESPEADKSAPEAHYEGTDQEPGRAMLFPSSLGMSFAVEPGTDTIQALATWGEYRRVDNPIPPEERPDWQQDDKFNRCWQRSPRSAETSITLADGDLGPFDFDAAHGTVRISGTCRSASTGFRLVTLFLHNRQLIPGSNPDEAWLFQPILEVRSSDGGEVFAGRGEAAGVATESATTEDQAERARLDMTYRRRVEFARGHAVSVTAEPSLAAPTRTDRICTTYLPTHEVQRTAPASPADRSQLTGLVTDMTKLADLSAEELRTALLPLADGYSSWLEDEASKLDSDPTLSSHREAAEDALYEAGLVADAICEGIGLLADGSDALEAFRFANRSMAEQRLRTDAIRARRDGDTRDLLQILDEYRGQIDTSSGENPHTRWRPFQLAFVLLNLAALADPTHKSRSSTEAPVDLLFFPTGGGKTEAYLGLVAATFALRRLQPSLGDVDGSDGVAVLMRYTLRLLTAQQFERAAALVCATENIRRSDTDRWGTVPFRLGMWVGGSLTPNRSKEANDALDKLRRKQRPYGGSPHQLAECPWCGEKLDPAATPRHILGSDDPDEASLNPGKRHLTYCPDEGCEFGKVDAAGEGIPVVTVDEDIYRLLPTFIIGTIDKFAQLPWNPNVRMLFGRVTDHCPEHGWRGPDGTYWPDVCSSPTGHVKVKTAPASAVLNNGPRLRPPDLIIQDELHLITGPLGTLAGLYETAIDELSTWTIGATEIHAKIVASTATIRRAAQQTRAVFARQTRIFPPQVLDVDDTFFARELTLDQSAGRLYVGVCASGRRLKEAESRLFRTVMAAAQHQWNEAESTVPPGEVNPADPWMTTVGYFSAIRELAGMYRIATDELQNRLRRIERDRRGFLAPRFASEFDLPDGSRKRMWWQPDIVELTSRVGAADLRDVLNQLFQPHRFRIEKSDKSKSGFRLQHEGIDLVLATNMISVGVDVSRLGMMVVVGQPKTTAEYIQASSRVGRDYDKAPGVVFTLSNWARPRDLSHWEQFEHYHDTFYRNVEAQSVTPFAPRALDRGATGVLVSLLRGGVDDWAPDRGVTKIAAADPRLIDAIDALRERADDAKSTKDQIEAAKRAAQLRADDLVTKLTEGTTTYAWRSRGEGSKKEGLTTLLHGAEDASGQQPWIMPNSLRNTEPGINVLIDRQAPAPPEPKWDWSAVGSGQAPVDEPTATTVDDGVDDVEAADLADALAEDATQEA
jgi:hypothetical protein